MNIVCPNCNAEYRSNFKKGKLVGQSLKCLYCKQKWISYNIYTEKKIEMEETSELKKMALDEYEITQKKYQTTNFEASRTNEGVQLRLKEASDRLKTNKEQLSKNANNSSNNPRFVNNSSLVGFLIASLLSITFGILYIYTDEIQKLYPQQTRFLLEYKDFVDHVRRTIQDLIHQSSTLIF